MKSSDRHPKTGYNFAKDYLRPLKFLKSTGKSKAVSNLFTRIVCHGGGILCDGKTEWPFYVCLPYSICVLKGVADLDGLGDIDETC